MTSQACPTETELVAFQLGDLPYDKADALASHLNGCSRCAQLAEQLDAVEDSVIAGLRQRQPGPNPNLVTTVSISPLATGPWQNRAVLHAKEAAPPGYEVLEELGRGGMGVVYRARDLKLNRLVALKMVLAGSQASQELLLRFFQEAKLAAALAHPNLCTIYETDRWTPPGADAPLPYLTLELCSGGSLAGQLGKDPMAPFPAAHLIEQVAHGLQHAHSRGVIHRDLKPENILFTEDGTPKVSDFGLARLLTATEGLTATDATMGTPSYMSPEQAAGRTNQADARSDVYSLGAVLYRMVTGRPPFQGPDVFLILADVIATDPVAPSRLVAGLPRDLETIVLHCLEKNPAKRYQTAQALAEDLRRFQAGEPITAKPVGAAERAWKWARRNPVVAVLTVVSITLLVGGLMATTLLLNWAMQERADAIHYGKEAAENGQKALKNLEIANQQLVLTKANLMTAQLRLVQNSFLSDPIGAQRLLHNPEVCPVEERSLAWHFFDHASHRLRLRLVERSKEKTSGMLAVRLVNNGTVAVAGAMDGTVSVWDLKSGQRRWQLKGHTGPIQVMWVAPDGTKAITGSEDKTVRIWDLTTGQELKVLEGHLAPVTVLAVSTDGKTVLSACGLPAVRSRNRPLDSTIRMWDVESGEQRAVLTGHSQQVTGLGISGDGTKAVSGSADRTLRIWNLQTNKGRVFPGYADVASAVWLAPDGKSAITAGWNTVQICDFEKEQIDSLRGHANLILSFQVLPETKLAISGSIDGTARIWNLESKTEQWVLRGHSGPVSTVQLSGDGKTAVSGGRDGSLRVWDLDTGRERALLQESETQVEALSLSEDGRVALASSADGALRVWDLIKEPAQTILCRQEHGMSLFKTSGDERVAVTSDWIAIPKGGKEYVLRVWDLATGTQRGLLKGHTRQITALWVSSDGSQAVSKSNDGTLFSWDLVTCKQRLSIQTQSTVGHVLGVTADGTTAVTDYQPKGNDGHGPLRIWDLSQGKEKSIIQGKRQNRVWSLWLAADGSTALSGSEDGKLQVWDLNLGVCSSVFPGHKGNITTLWVSPDTKQAISGSGDGTLCVWNLGQGTHQTLRGHTNRITGLWVLRDNATVVSGAADGELRVWDLETGTSRTMTGHKGPVTSFQSSVDEHELISGGQDGTARIWDLKTAQERAILRSHTGSITALSLLPERGELLSASEDGTLRVWDLSAAAD